MIKLELLVDEKNVDEVKELLRKIGITKIFLSEVKEYDKEYTHEEGYRGTKYIVDFIKKINISILLTSTECIDETLHGLAVANIASNILVYKVMQSYSISKGSSTKNKNNFTFS